MEAGACSVNTVGIRSPLDMDRLTARDHLAERRGGLQPCGKPIRTARFDGHRLLLGHATQHRTRAARLWRLRIRIKCAARAQHMGEQR